MRINREWIHREPTVLTSIVILSVALFVLTSVVTRAFRAEERHLAQRFYSSGGAALQADKPGTAIEDLRTALQYSPTNDAYRFKLAQALASAGRNKEAAAHLMNLWQSQPGDGEINLELARLAVRTDQVDEALRYFNAAIYGVWNQDAEEHRRDARLELTRFLMQKQQFGHADAQLLAIAGSLPAAVPLHLEVGSMFQLTGNHDRALNEFRWVLKHEPENETALLGAGQSSFVLGRYNEAALYLEKAEKAGAIPVAAQDMKTLASLVIKSTPYGPGLPFGERTRRTAAAYAAAGVRLQECAASRNITLDSSPNAVSDDSHLQKDYRDWAAMRPEAQVSVLRRDPDQIDLVMNLVFQIEADTKNVCGMPTGEDHALLLISAARSGGQK